MFTTVFTEKSCNFFAEIGEKNVQNENQTRILSKIRLFFADSGKIWVYDGRSEPKQLTKFSKIQFSPIEEKRQRG